MACKGQGGAPRNRPRSEACLCHIIFTVNVSPSGPPLGAASPAGRGGEGRAPLGSLAFENRGLCVRAPRCVLRILISADSTEPAQDFFTLLCLSWQRALGGPGTKSGSPRRHEHRERLCTWIANGPQWDLLLPFPPVLSTRWETGRSFFVASLTGI